MLKQFFLDHAELSEDLFTDYDRVRVHFKTGSTVIFVNHGDDIQAGIARLCEDYNWDIDSVTGFTIVDQTKESESC